MAARQEVGSRRRSARLNPQASGTTPHQPVETITPSASTKSVPDGNDTYEPKTKKGNFKWSKNDEIELLSACVKLIDAGFIKQGEGSLSRDALKVLCGLPILKGRTEENILNKWRNMKRFYNRFCLYMRFPDKRRLKKENRSRKYKGLLHGDYPDKVELYLLKEVFENPCTEEVESEEEQNGDHPDEDELCYLGSIFKGPCPQEDESKEENGNGIWREDGHGHATTILQSVPSSSVDNEPSEGHDENEDGKKRKQHPTEHDKEEDETTPLVIKKSIRRGGAVHGTDTTSSALGAQSPSSERVPSLPFASRRPTPAALEAGEPSTKLPSGLENFCLPIVYTRSRRQRQELEPKGIALGPLASVQATCGTPDGQIERSHGRPCVMTSSTDGTDRRRHAASASASAPIPNPNLELEAWRILMDHRLLPKEDLLRCGFACRRLGELAASAHAASARRFEAWKIILTYLPVKEILRSCAVCKTFRGFTSDKEFLVIHRSRQPSLPLVYFHGMYATDSNGDVAPVNAFLGTLDIRQTGGPLAVRLALGFNDYVEGRRNHDFKILDSCDGLLLLTLSDGRLYVCNPTTREWTQLQLPHRSFNFTALYHHGSEYHVLYGTNSGAKKSTPKAQDVYIFTLGSTAWDNPRKIDVRRKWKRAVQPVLKDLLLYRDGNAPPPVLVDGCLHWWSATTCSDDNINFRPFGDIVVFDPSEESFDLMHFDTQEEPVDHADLLEMGGRLGICCLGNEFGMKVATVSCREKKENNNNSWSTKFRIEMPVAEMIDAVVQGAYLRGNVVSENGDMLAAFSRNCCERPYLFHLDSKGNVLKKYRWDDMAPETSPHRFKESLVKHSFLMKRQFMRRGAKMEPRFFRLNVSNKSLASSTEQVSIN